MPKSNIPQIDDPYVGKVYGNLLDNYDSPTYNLKLYMLRKTISVAAPDGVAKLDYADEMTSAPADQIILAQTGVTAASIDDLSIEALTSTDGPNAISVDFTVTQPGSATFLDQMQMARAYLDQESDYMPVVFLELRFQGYEADIDDQDEGGQFAQIAGPYRWKLGITGIEVEINAGGSVYNITTLPMKSYAYRSPFFKIPTNLKSIGKTITEHVESFKTELNKAHGPDGLATNEVPDEFDFDLSELLGAGEDGTVGPDKIFDETLYSSADQGSDDRNRLMNETFAIGDAVTAKQAFVDAPLDEGEEAEQVFEEDGIMISKDTTIEKYFATLLSMNAEFYTKISRKAEIDNADGSVQPEKAYVTWFKMDANVTQLKFDKSRNSYAHKITYKPRLYKSSRPDIAIDSKELDVSGPDNSKRAKQIFANGGLKKAYHYIFSGLNDQIKSLDIKYDTGIALLMPPAGGAVGQAALVLAEKAGGIAGDKDITLGGVVEELINAKSLATGKEVFKDFLDSINKLKDIASDGLSGLTQQLLDATGLSENVIIGALRDGDKQNQEALEEALAKKGVLNEINKANSVNAPVTTESFTEYSPELSGYNYAVDLVNPMETPLTADELEELGYLKLEDAKISTVIRQQVVTTENNADVDNQSATIKKGSVQNTMFGVIASQHGNDLKFLIELDMTLRGDPWYLGKDTNDNSNEEQANFYKDDNHFFLSMRSPKTFDMDWRDEDSELNTGYWKGDGVSRSFGGVYRLVSVVNNFSGGAYTCDVTAQRIVPMDEPKEFTEMKNAENFGGGTTEGKIFSDGLDGMPPKGYYNDFQMNYWMANGKLPVPTEDSGE